MFPIGESGLLKGICSRLRQPTLPVRRPPKSAARAVGSIPSSAI